MRINNGCAAKAFLLRGKNDRTPSTHPAAPSIRRAHGPPTQPMRPEMPPPTQANRVERTRTKPNVTGPRSYAAAVQTRRAETRTMGVQTDAPVPDLASTLDSLGFPASPVRQGQPHPATSPSPPSPLHPVAEPPVVVVNAGQARLEGNPGKRGPGPHLPPRPATPVLPPRRASHSQGDRAPSPLPARLEPFRHPPPADRPTPEHERAPEIICIQESHLLKDNQLRIRNYVDYRQEVEQKNSPGHGILIRKDLNYLPVRSTTGPFLNYQSVEVYVGRTKFLLTNSYLRINPKQHLHEDELRAVLERPYHILVGDLNAHSPAWGNRKSDWAGQTLERLTLDIGCMIENTGEPTRLATVANQKQTAIYLTITSNDFT
ncbi:RNA-directed DNA polymerase from mobile element jockey-like [Plakobranchus ocellatus]|uniref:RNA-directed DNA polymerase from mobile element jockey-like n=1 Tax=Plakobranchus ocellatus TaxID=259542 RepID=A0AAV4B983_9GAST|nr:RNA-directed DNA polymerase from mobile element jockey-like [Plakobranchus ocellatus]